MLVRHLDVRCESVLDPRLKCFCPSLKFTVWCWSQSAAETNIESSGGTFLCYLILLKCIFTWKPSYSFPIRASWFLDRGGSWTWTRPGCRVSQESQIQCWDLRRWCLYYQLSSHRDAAMHGLGGGDTFICYQDWGRKRKNARRCDKKWRRWSVGLLRWWRRGGGEREAAVRENTIHQDKFR